MNLAAVEQTQPVAPEAHKVAKSESILKLLTCGSVDDGKSTLIGRLLWDAAGVTDDQRAAILHASHSRAVNGERIDFSLLLDGLVAGAGDHTPLQVAVPAGATSAQYSGELYTIDSALHYDVNADGSVDYYDRLELGGALNSALGNAGYTLRADLDRDLDVDAADADILEALSCMADLNADGLHNFFDVSVFTGWLNTGDLNADLTGDGLLNFFDLSVFLEMYNVGCP